MEKMLGLSHYMIPFIRFYRQGFGKSKPYLCHAAHCFQIFNKNGESDYTQGFAPDIEVKEYDYWNNILPFGDENEVVLKAALDDIRGNIKNRNIKRL